MVRGGLFGSCRWCILINISIWCRTSHLWLIMIKTLHSIRHMKKSVFFRIRIRPLIIIIFHVALCARFIPSFNLLLLIFLKLWVVFFSSVVSVWHLVIVNLTFFMAWYSNWIFFILDWYIYWWKLTNLHLCKTYIN